MYIELIKLLTASFLFGILGSGTTHANDSAFIQMFYNDICRISTYLKNNKTYLLNDINSSKIVHI